MAGQAALALQLHICCGSVATACTLSGATDPARCPGSELVAGFTAGDVISADIFTRAIGLDGGRSTLRPKG